MFKVSNLAELVLVHLERKFPHEQFREFVRVYDNELPSDIPGTGIETEIAEVYHGRVNKRERKTSFFGLLDYEERTVEGKCLIRLTHNHLIYPIRLEGDLKIETYPAGAMDIDREISEEAQKIETVFRTNPELRIEKILHETNWAMPRIWREKVYGIPRILRI